MTADQPRDTIFAVATPPGRSGVAVTRVSGPDAEALLSRLTDTDIPPRRAVLTRLAFEGAPIDEALVLLFPGPRSFTGETVVEFQTHGSPTVLSALARALVTCGARPAEAGAFTRRAFENGQLDMTEVEGLADLLDAETEGQRLQALRLQGGGLSQATKGWIEALTQALAMLEAAIDFADEGDVIAAGNPLAPVRQRLREASASMRDALSGARSGERMREGLRIVVAGPPNAGKSTLLNALARRDVAIVTDRPGTTRDTLDVALDLGGVPVQLTDTAGFRDTDDPVERIGIARAESRVAEADLVLWLGDEEPTVSAQALWRVATKIDLDAERGRGADYAVSARTGEGMDTLLTALSQFAVSFAGAGEPALITRERQRLSLEDAAQAIERAIQAGEPELMAEDLRSGLHALHRLTGRFDMETVLDTLFAGFCIGK